MIAVAEYFVDRVTSLDCEPVSKNFVRVKIPVIKYPRQELMECCSRLSESDQKYGLTALRYLVLGCAGYRGLDQIGKEQRDLRQCV